VTGIVCLFVYVFLDYIWSRIVEITVLERELTLLTVYWKTQWVLHVLYHHVWHSEISCSTHRKNLFVWISGQTGIVLQYSINGLVFVTVVECVYCTVRSGYFKYIIPINLIIKVRAMAQADSRRPPTMETRVVPRWDLWWRKWHWDRFFSEYFEFSLAISLFHTHLHLHVGLTRRTNERSLGTCVQCHRDG